MDARLSELLEDVTSDRTSGAAQVTRKAAALIAGWIEMEPDPLPRNFCELGRAAIKGQPSMAPVINLINDALLELENAEQSHRNYRESLLRFVDGFTDRQHESISQTVNAALSLIHPGDRIATHSYSSTVRDLILEAKKQGIEFELVLTEGRPNLESRTLAKELGDAGVEVEFMTDMGLFAVLDEVKTVFVGADAVTRKLLINKAGTCAVAARCRQLGIPCYSLMTSEKLLAPGLEPLFSIVEHSPAEVWASAPESVKVRNIYFDQTPLDALTGLACEQGLLRPAQIEALIEARETSRLLAGSSD